MPPENTLIPIPKSEPSKLAPPVERVALSDYETVDTRLKRFWSSAQTKHGRIITEIVSPTGQVANGKMRWVVKASIWRDTRLVDDPAEPGLPDATGYATETDGHGDEITANSALETAETSAIGRALANLGKTGKSPRATREGVARTRAKADATKSA